ncbi:hypothetical protein [Paenibacillus sp. J22TS3]|uniref:hypothetical protein n=1 Tax=Paenibacillus sp. J22TS3 TaxID=2807192 RepID=UPI001B2AE9F5|nr:hypothetical protein [Paenibacillus sp. J22TS3]GIP21918.1 hypothetical protein J22TS3_21930 [Paenibacillus sp. J22TS3]
MFYSGNLLSISLAVVLLIGQGFVVYISFVTMGFLGMFTLPLIIANHWFCIFLTYRFTVREERTFMPAGRRYSVPFIMLRVLIGAVLIYLAYTEGYKAGVAPFTKTESEKAAVRRQAEKYLEQKYAEKFKVDGVEYIFAVDSYKIKPDISRHKI